MSYHIIPYHKPYDFIPAYLLPAMNLDAAVLLPAIADIAIARGILTKGVGWIVRGSYEIKFEGSMVVSHLGNRIRRVGLSPPQPLRWPGPVTGATVRRHRHRTGPAGHCQRLSGPVGIEWQHCRSAIIPVISEETGPYRTVESRINLAGPVERSLRCPGPAAPAGAPGVHCHNSDGSGERSDGLGS
eukprot:766342-Hanusia_phi.AAC.1